MARRRERRVEIATTGQQGNMNDHVSQERLRDSAAPDYPAGTPAPESGSYEQLNIFGRATGHRVTVEQGMPLPPLPRGFAWRQARDTR